MTVNILSVAVYVTRTFEALGVQYFLAGSFASTIHGMIRTTQDADIVALLEQRHVPILMERLNSEFYIDDKMIEDAIFHHSSFNIIHRQTMFKVDVFIPRMDHFLQSQLLRAQKHALSADHELNAFVASPEDTILAKLRWYEMGGKISDFQWRDILGIIKVQGSLLDRGYLRSMAEELGVGGLLKTAFEDAQAPTDGG